jgi:hypothetical protein
MGIATIGKGNLIYTETGMPENKVLVPLLSDFQVFSRCGEIGNPVGFQIIEINNARIP